MIKHLKCFIPYPALQNTCWNNVKCIQYISEMLTNQKSGGKKMHKINKIKNGKWVSKWMNG